MDIFKKINDIYYKKESENSNVIRVLRNSKDSGTDVFDYSSLKMIDFFDSSNNERFSKICSSLFSFNDKIRVKLQIRDITSDKNKDFVITRKNLGEILAAIAEYSAGNFITDRAGHSYVFGEPINFTDFRKQFMD